MKLPFYSRIMSLSAIQRQSTLSLSLSLSLFHRSNHSNRILLHNALYPYLRQRPNGCILSLPRLLWNLQHDWRRRLPTPPARMIAMFLSVAMYLVLVLLQYIEYTFLCYLWHLFTATMYILRHYDYHIFSICCECWN